LEGFGKVAFKFVKSIYKGGWDNLFTRNSSKPFCNKIREEFTVKVPTTPANRKTDYFPSQNPWNLPTFSLLHPLPKKEDPNPDQSINQKKINPLTCFPNWLISTLKPHLLIFGIFSS